ncbi:CynX/NimT family MFS transporter [Acinetobacter pseudolwoffii]|uniref:MFS transporter n=1 Tax=Acinetobacter pseudolwoffii TaxID=2053287 RepID=A0A2H9UQ94_9GAMM|nr:MFS transporter [Acinetobacter pseudolwoffii]PJI33871.1 MFS transporter [Acinetobacter pseudolwoffii]
MSKISIRDLWIILAGYLAAIHVGKLSAVIPILQQDLGLSFTQAGFSLSLVQGAGMLFALCIGALSEKVGLKRCLILALIILGLSSMAGLWIQHVAALYFFRFTEGIGFLTISLCAPAILKRISRAETLNFKMGLWSSYMGVGVSLTVFTIPMLLEYLSWQSIWAILGSLCLLIAVMIKRYLYLEAVTPVQPNRPQAGTENTSFWQIIKVTLTHPPILCLAIIFACYTSQWITVTGFLPTLYVEHGIDLKVAGALVSMVVLANLGGTFGAGMLLQGGWKPKTLLSTGFIAMLCSSLLTFAASSWLSFELQFVSAVLFSLIGGMIPTTIFAITLRYAPRANAAAASVGLVLQVSACAQFFVPPLSAALVSTTQQWPHIATVTACLSILGILMTLLLFKRYA